MSTSLTKVYKAGMLVNTPDGIGIILPNPFLRTVQSYMPNTGKKYCWVHSLNDSKWYDESLLSSSISSNTTPRNHIAGDIILETTNGPLPVWLAYLILSYSVDYDIIGKSINLDGSEFSVIINDIDVGKDSDDLIEITLCDKNLINHTIVISQYISVLLENNNFELAGNLKVDDKLLGGVSVVKVYSVKSTNLIYNKLIFKINLYDGRVIKIHPGVYINTRF